MHVSAGVQLVLLQLVVLLVALLQLALVQRRQMLLLLLLLGGCRRIRQSVGLQHRDGRVARLGRLVRTEPRRRRRRGSVGLRSAVVSDRRTLWLPHRRRLRRSAERTENVLNCCRTRRLLNAPNKSQRFSTTRRPDNLLRRVTFTRSRALFHDKRNVATRRSIC